MINEQHVGNFFSQLEIMSAVSREVGSFDWSYDQYIIFLKDKLSTNDCSKNTHGPLNQILSFSWKILCKFKIK